MCPQQPPADAPNELTKAVDELLDTLTNSLSKASTEVFAKRMNESRI